MYRGHETPGSRDAERGKRELARHRPDLALRSLKTAADSCPASRSGELSELLYWLAVALLRLDRPELAIKSLASAQKLRQRGVARAAYRARVNQYGMIKRASPELDDFYAFYSIHVAAYLYRREASRFESASEKDEVVRMIGGAWLKLSRSGRLCGRSPAEKLSLFREWPVGLPTFRMEERPRPEIIRADFRRGRRIGGDDRCSCGSGLPFRQCCGRTSSLHEFACE